MHVGMCSAWSCVDPTVHGSVPAFGSPAIVPVTRRRDRTIADPRVLDAVRDSRAKSAGTGSSEVPGPTGHRRLLDAVGVMNSCLNLNILFRDCVPCIAKLAMIPPSRAISQTVTGGWCAAFESVRLAPSRAGRDDLALRLRLRSNRNDRAARRRSPA